jgi:hypothetical protein
MILPDTTARYLSIVTIALFTFAADAFSQNLGASTGKYLYTKPDPSVPGGISGTILRPARPIVEIFANPPSDPAKLYRGIVSGIDRQQFHFKGLPAAKYDLFILYDKTCFEGLMLSRDDTSLTSDDRIDIRRTIEKSETFFEKKKILRIEGQTGKGSQARAIVEFLRFRQSVDYEGNAHLEPRRSLKLVILKQVGPGWQIVSSREFDVRFFKRGVSLNHRYNEKLNRIRVVDSVKDLGTLNLLMK